MTKQTGVDVEDLLLGEPTKGQKTMPGRIFSTIDMLEWNTTFGGFLNCNNHLSLYQDDVEAQFLGKDCTSDSYVYNPSMKVRASRQFVHPESATLTHRDCNP